MAALLPEALRGQWFHFRDQQRERYCQTDFLFSSGPTLAIIECKFSYHPYLRQQMLQVYKPVVEAAYGRGAICIAIIRAAPSRQRLLTVINGGREFTVLRQRQEPS